MNPTLLNAVKRFVRLPIGRSILMYHRIAVANFDPWNMAVSPVEFEIQLNKLRTKTVLPLVEFARLHRKRQLPRNVAAITFDDGYACNALVAAPILNSFALPATFFIVSDAIGSSDEFWWDQLEAIVNAPGFDYEIAKRSLGIDSSAAHTANVLTNKPVGAYAALWRILRVQSSEKRSNNLDNLRNRVGLQKIQRPTHRPMTGTELRKLSLNPLFEIGGHTVTHPTLPILPPVEQEREIVYGSNALKKSLGFTVRCFSYPFGDYAPVTREIVSAGGFECAVTTEARRVRADDDQFGLPRRQALNRIVPA